MPLKSNPTLLPPRKTKNNNTIRGQHTQSQGNRLAPRLNNTRDGTTPQHRRREQSNLLAVTLARAEPRKAEHVQSAHGEACCDGRHGARFGVPDCAAEGGQQGEG